MPRIIKKFLVVNAITGEMKLRSRASDVLDVEIAFSLVVTLPTSYPRYGGPISITLPALPEPAVSIVGERIEHAPK